MTEVSTAKVLGIAEYEARWIQRSFMVRLTAKGVLPCYNYEAQLEKRPERVVPPMWDMVFFVQDYCQQALKPFEIEVIILNAEGAKTISVRDATGEHQIDIHESTVPGKSIKGLQLTADLDQFIVYGKLPKTDKGHFGCIIVPADSFVTAIHYRAFGPASREECEAFVLKNCIFDSPLPKGTPLFGGEIPWPLLTEK